MASPSQPDAPGLVVRGFWAFPAGSAAFGAVEMLLQARRIGWDPLSFALGSFAAALPGIPLGILVALVLALAWRRFRWKPPPIPARVVAGATAIASAIVVVTLAGWWVAALVLDRVHRGPLNFRAAELPLARGAIFVAVALGLLVLYALVRVGENWLAQRPWTIWVGRVAGTVALLVGCLQVLSDQLVYYYGPALPPALLLAWAGVAAAWLPARVRDTPKRRRIAWAGALAVVVLGVGGLHHVGARGLLMHDPRTFPRAFADTLGVLDLDGDGDFPRWLGGTDCDDFDARAAGWRVEIPGNGVDDNCALGDRAPSEPVPPPLSSEGPRPPIFLITIDTVGADHLDLYGYERETMPALTALARSSRWFRRAYAPSNQTYYSTVATLSGQSPEKMLQPATEEQPGQLRFSFWLPHRLAALGYHTVAFAPPLYDLQKMSLEELRFAEVDPVERDYAELGRGTNSRAVVDAVIRRVEGDDRTRPLFAWIHLVDPHAVHEAPLVFPTAGPADVWDSELAYVDAQLARLFHALQVRYGRDVIIVVTSDHGEQFGERGFYGHAYSLFEALIRVPLIIYAPSLDPGVVETPVSVLGVVPSLLALIGQAQDPRLSSPPLVPDAPAPAPVLAHAPAYGDAEQRMEVALIDGSYKLIRNRRAGTSLLFDLALDPGETRNLAAVDPRRRRAMENTLLERLEAEP